MSLIPSLKVRQKGGLDLASEAKWQLYVVEQTKRNILYLHHY